MKPFARIAAVALSLAAVPAQAADFCAALQTVAMAAAEPVPFKSITGGAINNDPGRLATSASLPGFAQCEIQPKRGTSDYSCYTLNLGAAQMKALEASMLADLGKCLGNKLVRESETPISRWTAQAEPGSYPLLALDSAAGQVAFTFTTLTTLR